MGAVDNVRNKFRPYYAKFRPIYVPILRFANLLLGDRIGHANVQDGHVLSPKNSPTLFQAVSSIASQEAAPSLPPFDAFLKRARSEARFSNFHPRYPFALERGPSAKLLQPFDPNSRFGHEPELAHLIDLLVPDDGVFLDVGSNAGYFSIYLAARPNFHGRIHAFEPVASTFATLREVVESLQCDKTVTCHQSAVSDELGTAKMEVESANSGLASLKDGSLEDGETVQKITLDSLELDRADLIKIDVEGHEAHALRGAETLIRSKTPFIFLESWEFAAQPDKVFEPLQFLIDRGYQLYLPAWAQSNGTFFVGIGPSHEMDRFALVPFTLKDRLTFPGNPINIFACPRSREARLGELSPSARHARR